MFVGLGFITLSLGLLGIVTPGLPTTPFLLLTAFLFAKGSPRLHRKLMENKVTGRYINKVNDGFGVKGLMISIGIMWIMICITAFFVFAYGTMRFAMIGLGIIGTVAQIIVLRKKKKAITVSMMLEQDNTVKEQEIKAS